MSRYHIRLALPLLSMIAVGCMHPGYNQYPYQYQYQPGYQPAGSYGIPPGALEIPQTNAPPYEPTGVPNTYDTSPSDSFDLPNSGTGTGNPADRVPPPQDPQGGNDGSFFDIDGVDAGATGPGYITTVGMAQPAALAVNGAARPVSYGFDRHEFRWLQGILSYNEVTGSWNLQYNPRADDTFRGDMNLIADADVLESMQSGMVVQVRGSVDTKNLDTRGRAMYRADSAFEISTLANP